MSFLAGYRFRYWLGFGFETQWLYWWSHCIDLDSNSYLDSDPQLLLYPFLGKISIPGMGSESVSGNVNKPLQELKLVAEQFRNERHKWTPVRDFFVTLTFFFKMCTVLQELLASSTVDTPHESSPSKEQQQVRGLWWNIPFKWCTQNAHYGKPRTELGVQVFCL